MSFMSSYKHLDHLCQDMYPYARNGISGYIEDMEKHPRGSYQVRGWDDDYRSLKHYRWIRNQIAHEVYADEDTVCEPGDIAWLENFYQRIMSRTDPIALAYNASKPAALVRKAAKPAELTSKTPEPAELSSKTPKPAAWEAPVQQHYSDTPSYAGSYDSSHASSNSSQKPESNGCAALVIGAILALVIIKIFFL